MGRNVKWGVVELFAGIGGVAQGFATQGQFEIIALTDIDADARDTLRSANSRLAGLPPMSRFQRSRETRPKRQAQLTNGRLY